MGTLATTPLQYQEFKPCAILEPYVKCYYTLECKEGTLIEDQAFATGCIEVMFTLEGNQWQTRKDGHFTQTSPVEVWGQILNPLSFRATGASKVFGIRFYPAAPAFLLRADINQFNDGVFDLAGVVGNSILSIHEQVQEAQSINRQIQLVENFLIQSLMAHPKTVDKISLVRKVMAELTRQDFFDNINNVAARYGITSRYLQKVFVQYTGIPPKLYAQINRFQNSLVLLSKKESTLTDVAYACGYFDQSHFIREFKSFTGFSPAAFPSETSTAALASPNK